METMQGFGARLWEAGKCNTYAELGKKLDMPPTTVSQWVRELNVPRADAVVHICRKLDVTADWLLGLSEEAKKTAVRTRPEGNPVP